MKKKITNLTLSTTDFSGNATSTGFDISDAAAVAIQIEITATGLSGTLKLQGTNIENASWSDVSGASITYTTQTATLNWLQNLDAPAYKYVRIHWTRTAGSGTCTVANISQKAS